MASFITPHCGNNLQYIQMSITSQKVEKLYSKYTCIIKFQLISVQFAFLKRGVFKFFCIFK